MEVPGKESKILMKSRLQSYPAEWVERSFAGLTETRRFLVDVTLDLGSPGRTDHAE